MQGRAALRHPLNPAGRRGDTYFLNTSGHMLPSLEGAFVSLQTESYATMAISFSPAVSLERSVLCKRVLQATLGRCRAARRADHVDEGAQRGRDLPLPGIIEEQSLKRWRPVFQYADQLARAQERLG